MPVYQLAEMPYEEYQKWNLYLSKRPVGWREDHRTSLLMLSAGAKITPDKVFPSLKMLNSNSGETEISKSLINSPFFSKMMNAVGGDRINE